MSKQILPYHGKQIGVPVELPEVPYDNNLLFLGRLLGFPVIDTETGLTPKRITKKGRTTVVYWSDNTITAVRRSPDEPDNNYFAFTAALAKRIFRTNSNIKRIIETKTEVQKPKND